MNKYLKSEYHQGCCLTCCFCLSVLVQICLFTAFGTASKTEHPTGLGSLFSILLHSLTLFEARQV